MEIYIDDMAIFIHLLNKQTTQFWIFRYNTLDCKTIDTTEKHILE